jgi:hypothetical protein
LKGRERNGGGELMTPKTKVARESKPWRLVVSKTQLPWAYPSFHRQGRNEIYVISVTVFIIFLITLHAL